MHPGGTLNFYELFFEFKFGLNSKNKLPLVASVFILRPPISLISQPPPPFQLGLHQMYASMLILEEQSLHLKCTLSVGTKGWHFLTVKA